MRDKTYVVVPFYNEASVVGTTVDVLAEHFSNIVCVDDGSSDGGGTTLRGSGCSWSPIR